MTIEVYPGGSPVLDGRDHLVAADLKQRISTVLEAASELMTEALRQGFHVSFSIPETGTRYTLMNLRLEKHF